MCVYVCVCVCARACVCLCMCEFVCVYVYLYVSQRLYVYVCEHAPPQACTGPTSRCPLQMQRNDPTRNDCLEATIMKNTNSWLATVSACPSGYTSSSNMAVSWLRAGDKVHVQTVDGAEIFGHTHTTFSGMKL